MKSILVILFLIESVCSLQAGDSYYYFKQISINEGLPSSVTAIYDDEDGFLWIGTIYGIYRFDGEKLSKFPFSDSLQISPYIHDVLSDNQGHIWVFTNQGVSLYNSEKDILEPFHADGKSIKSYNVLSDENHIIFPIQGELLRFDKSLKNYTRLILQQSNKKTSIIKLEVYDAKYYIGLTNERSLIFVNRNTGEIKATPFNITDQVWDFYRDTKKRYWISIYGRGLSCYTIQGELIDSYTSRNSGLNNAAILDIEERNQQIWLATDGGGINIIDPETRQVSILSNQENNHFPTNSVTKLNNGTNNMWIGMVREGVLGAKENFITSYSKSSKSNPIGMSEKCPLCLLEDADGTIWIGTDGGGINSFNPQMEQFTHYPATSGEKIVSLCAYSEDELLISNYLTGVHVFNKKRGTYRKFTVVDKAVDKHIVGTGFPINLLVNKKNEIEFHGCSNYRYNKEKRLFTPLKVPQGKYLSSWMYIGSYQSKPYFHDKMCIFRYNYQTDAVEPVYENSSRDIIASCLDNKGKVWIANRNNLICLDIDSGCSEVVKLPDNNNLVTSLVIDQQGVIWMGTPGALYSYFPYQNRFVIFSESDGVLPNDFLPKPVLVTRDDNIYMGGAMGLVRINKALNRNDSLKDNLRVKLLDVRLNGSVIPISRNQDLSSLEVASDFTLLEIQTKLYGTDLFRKRIYRYQIEGLSDEYTESPKSHFKLQVLPSGSYIINVQCTMANGLWSQPFKLLHLTVLPPWWQRTWFITLMILLILSALIYVVHLRELRIQRRLREKERQLYKDKVQALININHELRTPLTLIYSPLKQLLNSKQMPYELRSKLQGVLKQTRQMKNIINMILNIRRMEVGQNKLCLTPTLLNDWLQTIVLGFKGEFETRNIFLLFKFDSRVNIISFDTNQCEIIVNNLLMNAYKFSNPGSTVTLSTQLAEKEGFVRIEIIDEGTGISDEDFPKLFTRFQRGNHNIEGCGIGLSYAKQLVEMHGGYIDARNNKEKGVTFCFTLPIHQELAQVACPIKPYLNDFLPPKCAVYQEKQAEQLAKFHSILIVESDPDLCDYMKANLQSIFEKTFVAHDGMEALPIIVSQLPQLIISDVKLPRISGLELCRKVKQNPETNFIPVILLAPDMDTIDAEDGYKTGADAYVGKPFDMDLLIVQVQTMLENRKMMRKYYLTTLETNEIPNAKINNHLDEQFVIHLTRVIADNLSNSDLDVNMVTKLMRMSRASLYSKMKITIGIGVNEYITKQRIQFAKQQLTTTELTIREISEKAGFLHQRNFSAVFKNITGFSPSDYRKETKCNV